MDQQEMRSVGGRFPTQRVTLPMSEAARASLVAVRVAQEAARERARRQTLRTRAWLGGIVGGLAFGLVVFGARPARHAVSAAAPARAAVVAHDKAMTTAMATSLPAPPLQVSTPLAQGPSAAADGTGASSPDSTCTEAFGQRRWRLSIQACTQAFESHPTDGAIALRLAHAYHGRARLPEAGEWAKRAIALDPKLAEAFVIVAHAEAQAGHGDAVIDAYRGYLALAPRGWHASEARAAVRGHAHSKDQQQQQQQQQHAQLSAPGHDRNAVAVSLAAGK